MVTESMAHWHLHYNKLATCTEVPERNLLTLDIISAVIQL